MSKNEERTEKPQPPSNTYLDWQSYFSSILTGVSVLLAVLITFIGIYRKLKMQVITLLETILEKEKKSSYQSHKAIQREIKSCVVRAQVISKADRVLLWQIHNGEIYQSQQSRYKVSVTSEEPSRGFERIEEELQDVPIALFHKELSLLEYYKIISVDLDKELIYKDSESENLSEHWQLFLARYGIVFCYETAVVKDGEVVGILSFQYSQNSREQIKQFDDNYYSIMNVTRLLEATLSNL